MQTKQLTNQYSQLNTIVIRNTLNKYYVNTGTSLKMILHCEFYGQKLQLQHIKKTKASGTHWCQQN
jgi:hypothetical protein